MKTIHLRAIAIDDEPLALQIIEAFCERMGGIELKTFTNANNGIAAARMEHPDVLLLDIDLGKTNGVDLARQLPHDIGVVFTTAYSEFAIDGFELDAVDYLEKPFPFSRFQDAMRRVARRANQNELLDKNAITVKANYQNVVIPFDDIIYLEALDNYVCFHLTANRQVTTQSTLSSLLMQLPEALFLRIHKSFVVARRKIERYTRRQVFMLDLKQPLPIGRSYAKAFNDILTQNAVRP